MLLSNSSKLSALAKILQNLPAHLVYHGSLLGAIVLASGGQLPPGLEFVAGGIGANLLSNLIDELVRGGELSEDEIRQRTEEAIVKSDIADLLTKQDFLQGYSRLIQRLDAQINISQDIQSQLISIFGTMATSEQVNELKHLLIQASQSESANTVQRSIFMSYARADALDFAQKLHDDLEALKFDVWLDKNDMPSGNSFIDEIDHAIREADYFLLIFTPGATQSEYCQDEWQKALEHVKPIIPLLRKGNYEDLPQEANIYLNDAPDFRNNTEYNKGFDKLLTQLRNTPRPAGKIRGVPDLPRNYLIRDSHIDNLRIELTKRKTTVLASVNKRIGIHGMGGIGKSVVTYALARDYVVRRSFPDGIFWLRFGTKPNLQENWTRLRRWLDGSNTPFNNEIEAADFFESKMSDRECLIILDDVWDIQHIAAFKRFGDRSCLLITSRHLNVLTEIDAYPYELGLLNDSDARQLLAQTAELDINALPEGSSGILKSCGNLPLALGIIGAMVSNQPDSYWQDALEALQVADLESLKAKFPDYPYPNLLAAIEVSVQALNQELQEKLYDFAIFPDDVSIPEAVLFTFWKPMEIRLVRSILSELVDRNLIKREDSQSYNMHDLQLAYLRNQARDLPAMHTRLLQNYNPKNDPWHLVADEYLFLHLGHHLDALNRQNEFIQTILRTREWLDNKFIKCHGDSAYLDDIASVSQVFENPLNASDTLILGQLTAARHVVQHRNRKYEDRDLQTLVWIGREAEAISHARLRSATRERIAGLLNIFFEIWNKSSEDVDILHSLVDDIRDIIFSIKDTDMVGDLYLSTAVALILLKEPREALNMILHSPDDDILWDKNYCLFELGTHMVAHSYFEDAWKLAAYITDTRFHDKTIYYIARSLAEEKLLDETFQAISKIQGNDVKIYALADVGFIFNQNNQLTASTNAFQQAMKLVDGVQHTRSNLRERLRLVSRLTEIRYEIAKAQKLLASIETEIQTMTNGSWKVEYFVELAKIYDYLDDTQKTQSLISEAFVMTTQIETKDTNDYFDDHMQVNAFKYIVQYYVALGDFEQAEIVIDHIQSAWNRVEMYCELARSVHRMGSDFKHIIEKAISVCDDLKEPYWKKHSWRNLAFTLARLEDSKAAKRVLEQILGFEESPPSDLEWIKQNALERICYVLADHGLVNKSIELSKYIDGKDTQIKTLLHLAQIYLETNRVAECETTLSKALDIFKTITDNDQRNWVDRDIQTTLQLLAINGYRADPEIWIQVGNHINESTILLQQAFHEFHIHNFEKALETSKKANMSTDKAILLCMLIRESDSVNTEDLKRVIINESIPFVVQNETKFERVRDFIEHLISLGISEMITDLLDKAQEILVRDATQNQMHFMPQLIGLALKFGEVDRAQDLVELITSKEYVIDSQCQIAVYWLQSGNDEKYLSMLNEIEREITNISQLSAQGKALKKYVWALCHNKEYTKAHDIIQTIEHDESNSSARRTLVNFLADNRQYIRATEIAYDIQRHHDRSQAIKYIASCKFNNGDLDGALNTFYTINVTNNWDIHVMLHFADQLIEVGESSAATAIADHARSSIKSMKDNRDRSEAGDHLLSFYANHGYARDFFDTLNGSYVDVFINAIVKHSYMLDTIENGLSIDIIREVTRIAGWIQPFWMEVHISLMQN